jgi:IclR family acetate operon transcriptional repressor
VTTRQLRAPARDQPASGRNQSSSLRRALSIVDYVEQHGGGRGVSLTELSDALVLNKSTILRLVAPLLETRLLHRDPETGRFRLGLGALRLGQAYLSTLDLRSVASAQLRALQRASGVARGLPAITLHTITAPDRLRTELHRIADRGYAVNDRENELEVRCVAAPIFDHTDQVVGALSVSGLTSRMTTARVRELAPLVARAGRAVSRELGSSR